MPLIESFVCARCSAIRQKSNHWYLAFPAGSKSNAGLEFQEWTDGAARVPAAIHLCGETCAIKQLSEFMETSRSREAAKP